MKTRGSTNFSGDKLQQRKTNLSFSTACYALSSMDAVLPHVGLLIIGLGLVAHGAALSTKYAGRLAESFDLPKYVIGFIIVAVISILPETFIALDAAFRGIPSFGLGTLLGSNIADLTLIFAALVFIAGRSLKIETKILKYHAAYPFVLLVPLILGADGYFSRIEGVVLIILGVLFYILTFKNGSGPSTKRKKFSSEQLMPALILLAGMALLLMGAHYTVSAASSLAHLWGLSPLLVGLIVVGLGTTIPEFFFSLQAVKKRDDSLAVGDLLGTVLADATIVVGLLALVSPFSFPPHIIYITGAFMVSASFLLFHFMRSGRALNRPEAYMLVVFWIAFVVVQVAAGI